MSALDRSGFFDELQAVGAVTALVGTRVYPHPAPQSAAFPYVTYQRISGAPVQALSGAPNLTRAGVQVGCYSDASRVAAWQVHEAVRDALVASTAFAAIMVDESDGPEDNEANRAVYSVISEYSIHAGA